MQLRLKFAAVVSVLAAVGCLAAGCGSGPSSPGVAHLGSGSSGTTTTGSTEGGAVGGGGPSTSSGRGSGSQMTMKLQNGAKLSACMRSHGVPNFPDPSKDGTIQIGSSSGIDPNSPKFRAAQDACQKLLPHGPPPTPQEQAKVQRAMLAFSACMRRHGLPDFPDPTFSNGRISIGLGDGPGGKLDPNSPKFKAAQEACHGKLPGMKGGPASR
jgi:hypothetical protein